MIAGIVQYLAQWPVLLGGLREVRIERTAGICRGRKGPSGEIRPSYGLIFLLIGHFR